MNTPDTEWQEDFFEYFKGNIDGESKLHCNTKYVREFIQQLLSSRDTYWKERVRKEVEGMASKTIWNVEGKPHISSHDLLQALDNLK